MPIGGFGMGKMEFDVLPERRGLNWRQNVGMKMGGNYGELKSPSRLYTLA